MKEVASVLDVIVFTVTTAMICVVVIISIVLTKFEEGQKRALSNVIDNRRILACCFAPAVVDVLFHSGTAISVDDGDIRPAAQAIATRVRRSIACFPSCLVDFR